MSANPASIHGVEDALQRHLTEYAAGFDYGNISAEAIHAAKARLINTLGALLAGFYSEPGRVARAAAWRFPPGSGATIIGTRRRTLPEVAALANTMMAGYVEMGDTYHWPGSFHGHPSDVIMPVLAAAEAGHASGRELIQAIVLAYEVYLRLSDVFHNEGYDYTPFGGISTAIAAGKLWKLDADQISQAIAMAVVSSNILKQARRGSVTMFKSASAGHAGRAGLFAARLARAGMLGPDLPFEGEAGWCKHIALARLTLSTFGGKGTRFKILDTRIKNRSSSGPTISAILAAEKIAPLRNLQAVHSITVESYKHAIERGYTDKDRGDPQSAESADHSLPYLVAATLLDGTVTRNSFDDAHLWNPALRGLMRKMQIVENPEFTRAYDSARVEHRMRVTLDMSDGTRHVGESGGDDDDLSGEMSDDVIGQKFHGIADDLIGSARSGAILERLWDLESMSDVAAIPPECAIV